jgi:hypothetical protein
MAKSRMILYPVDSSMLAAVGYDAKAERMVVLFNTGKAYTYAGVPLKVYLSLISAESKGQFMNEKVIGTYPGDVFKGWEG